MYMYDQSDQSLRSPPEETLERKAKTGRTRHLTGRLAGLIRVFAGRKYHFSGFVVHRLKFLPSTDNTR